MKNIIKTFSAKKFVLALSLVLVFSFAPITNNKAEAYSHPYGDYAATKWTLKGLYKNTLGRIYLSYARYGYDIVTNNGRELVRDFATWEDRRRGRVNNGAVKFLNDHGYWDN